MPFNECMCILLCSICLGMGFLGSSLLETVKQFFKIIGQVYIPIGIIYEHTPSHPCEDFVFFISFLPFNLCVVMFHCGFSLHSLIINLDTLS